MSETIVESLKSADGVRLDQPQYQKDFDANLWRDDGADSWKLERLQNYSETGFPSWEAYMAGDWKSALRLYEAERPNLVAFSQEFQRHRSHLYRVRVVVDPITPYLQWELHCLRLRAECGEKIRVVNHSQVSAFESADPLPELISLCGRVLYHVLYDDNQEPDGAIRYDDPELISHYEKFARHLYGGGEDIESYFRRRKIAELPPPRL
jgi:hypothetical protein